MPPLYVKGGVWTNVEDEILKAAVSKYGLNQWARVSSLLVKKTAKQAKARWQEYLNPNVNKSDWTREEDEKLLRLAKLVPNQWRSIAPIMGRTATNCVERFQKLLDDASGLQIEGQETSEDFGLTGPGIESIPSSGTNNVGDLNIHPESKPARPDEEEMNEEEREMLSEARARLANTQGKKAKRKARERMLEETKRISQLQKRRELKAAGINVSIESKNKKKRKEFDYNADIPHEVTPQLGLYDVSEELNSNLVEGSTFNKSVQEQGIPFEKNDKKEKRKSESKNKKRSHTEDYSSTISQDAELNIDTEPSVKRHKLSLATPVADGSLTGHVETPFANAGIDERILRATLEIKANQSTPSSLISSGEAKSDSVSKPHINRLDSSITQTIPNKKTSSLQVLRKKLASLIERLPAPKSTPELYLPSFDNDESSISLTAFKAPADAGDDVDVGERNRNLEILKSKDLEQAEKRKSQAIQLGLEIPSPESIKTSNKNISELEKMILAEVKSLIKSDYKKYQDPEYDAELVNDLNQEDFESVHKEISEDLLSNSKQNGTIVNDEPSDQIDKTFSTAEKIIYLLHEYSNKAQEIESKLTSVINFEEVSAEHGKLWEKIQLHFDELEDVEINTHNYLALQAAEEGAIEARTSRLQNMVDSLVEAEQLASSILRTKRREVQTTI